MMPLPAAVSVVMRNYNEGWAIGETIRQLFAQDYPGEIEWLVIDSGSTDDSLAQVRAAKVPVAAKVIEIPPGTYVPGVVLNRGVRETSHDWVVFLNADAPPADVQWLSRLLAACVACDGFGAAYSRQLPRPDCQAVFAHDYARAFGEVSSVSPPWDGFFSMVSSVSHRRVLEAHPFREDLQYAEDNEWARRLDAAGLRVLYCAESRVVHSHNYTLAQAYRRSFGDARALAAAGILNPREGTWPWVLGSAARAFARDVLWMGKHGQWAEIPHAGLVRWQQRRGHRAGFRSVETNRNHPSRSAP